ncbi:MAG: amidohydrolase family protein [Propionibacteriaceae bacterium]
MTNTLLAEQPTADRGPRFPIIDCDIHNVISPGSLDPYLSNRWLQHQRTYGSREHTGAVYPKGSPGAARTDAAPPSGLAPGADLGFMQEQHLDPMGVEYGVLNCLGGGTGQLDVEYGAALSSATNDWQLDEWIAKDDRLRGGIVVAMEDGELAAREIDRWADHPGFIQVLLVARTSAPLGDRRYWKIYEAAARHDLPVGVHFGGGSRGVPVTAAGWPSFYLEDHAVMSSAFQAHVTSLVLSGVFDRYPTLRIALIEGGFAWLPSLTWRLDAQWKRFGSEVGLRRRPSDYIRDHFWFTTQPIEEPHRRGDLARVFEHLGGVDKVMFSTDYPHWDFDSPTHAFQERIPADVKERIYTENARAFYGLPARSTTEPTQGDTND